MFGKKKYPRWSWDTGLKAGYLYIEPSQDIKPGFAETKSFSTPAGSILLDFDVDGKVVGIEVLG